MFDMNIVLDIYSGAVHVVDDCLYDMLDYLLEPFVPENECPAFIHDESLQKTGTSRVWSRHFVCISPTTVTCAANTVSQEQANITANEV